ncbi:MAG: LamG-like jellyroll fold domain-containing protein [Verrucomicrobiota bacterium]
MFFGTGTQARAELVGHWLSGAENLENVSSTGSVHNGVGVGGTLGYSTDLPPGFTDPALRSLSLSNGAAVEIANSSTSDAGYLDTFDQGTSNQLTVAFWAKGFPGDWSPWLAKDGEGAGWQVRRIGGSSGAGFTLRGLPNDNGGDSPINVNDANWHHFAAVWDASTFTRALYVDGVFSHEIITGDDTIDLATGRHLVLGARQNEPTGYSHFFTGNLFDVRIYNHALEQTDVFNLIPQLAPQGLAATVGSQKVNLTWTPSLGATEYTVWTKNTITDGESTETIAAPPFLKQGLTNGVPYLFKVLGTNSINVSGPYSAEITATPVASAAKEILTFDLDGLGPATISGTNITKYVSNFVDVMSLGGYYTVSPFASEDGAFPSGTSRDFSDPQTYTITAEDFSTKAYTVTVIQADPLTYDFNSGLQGWTQVWPAPGALWENEGLGTPEGPTADGAETRFGRSPDFYLNNLGPLTFQLGGGQGNLAAPGVSPSAIPQNASSDSGFAGVALRDVATNTYILAKRRAGNGGGYSNGSFTLAELAPYANDGKRYTLDFIDYNKGGWGWTRLDNVSIPGTIAPALPEANIIGFTLSNPSTIATVGDNITITVPYGTALTALAPTYFLSAGATCDKPSGSPQNFTSPVNYTVTSSDLAVTRVYHVAVVVMPDPALGLVGHWVSGTETLADTSGYAPTGTHDGVAVGGNAGLLTYSSDVPTGFSGKSLDLSAGNVGVSVSNSADTDAGYMNTFDGPIRSQFTISFWAKGFPGTWSPWVSKGGENGVGWQLRRVDNDPVAGFTLRGLLNDDGRGSNINVNDTNWHHFAGVWDETTGVRSLYVDGHLSHDVITLGQMMNLASGRHLALGARQTDVNGGYGNYFSGLLYDVRIYKQKLFINQVQAISSPALFAAWINTNYPGMSDKTTSGDPDGDGMTSYQEFAFGLDPSSGSSVNPIVALPNKTTGAFSYTRLNPVLSGLTSYTVMTSTNLVDWTVDAGATASQTVTATNGDVQTMSVTLSGAPLDTQQLFVRVGAH